MAEVLFYVVPINGVGTQKISRKKEKKIMSTTTKRRQRYSQGRKNRQSLRSWAHITCAFLLALFFCCPAYAWTDEQICNAIYRAEGGARTRHPYGILTKYRHTTPTPRQVCLNTIAHARRDWNGKGDFLAFLRDRYCPIGAANDPTGLNQHWLKNVTYFLTLETRILILV